MRNRYNPKSVLPTSTALARNVAAALLLLGGVPAMAVHIQTPAELRDACQASPGNVVMLDHPIKVSLPGPGQASLVEVASGCTIVIGPGAKLEAEYLPMRFAGPLVIQSAHQTEVLLVKSRLNAPSITISLTGFGSAVGSSESTLEATSGNLILAMGAGAKVEMVNRLLPGPQFGLSATGMIQISGFAQFSGSLSENNIRADQGISIAMSQSNGLLKITQVNFLTAQGGIAISATGEKALLELSESHLRVRDGITLRLAGRESTIGMKQVSMGPENGVMTNGGVTIEASTGTSGSDVNGKIELSEVSIFDVATTTVRASFASQEGSIKAEKSLLSALGDVRIETGTRGVTEVKENQLASATLIRVAAGAGGSCIGQPNSISNSPLSVELCP